MPLVMDTQPRYYVYGFFDSEEIPFYIGKGTGDRIKQHENPNVISTGCTQFYKRLREMRRLRKRWHSRILMNGLGEEAALRLEHELISKHGRLCLDTGPLTNYMTAYDTRLEGFIATRRQVGRFSCTTRTLEKIYGFSYEDKMGKSATDYLIEDKFDPAGVDRVLRGLSRRYKGYFWDYVPRSKQVIEELKEAFPKVDAYLRSIGAVFDEATETNYRSRFELINSSYQFASAQRSSTQS